MLTWNWKKMFEKKPCKRALAKSIGLSLRAAEGLEQRAMMSAVMDNGNEAAEVSHVETHKAAVSYPSVAGDWLFSISIPGLGNYSNVPVHITQTGAKYFATGSVNGIDFEIDGKFNKKSPTESTGKGFFDNIPGVGNVRGSYTGTATQDGNSINGSAVVSALGQSVTVGVTGAKQVSAPVQTAHSVETHKAAVSYPDVSGNWLFTVDLPQLGSYSNVAVHIDQDGAKYFATGTVNGIDFAINGKFNKSNPTASDGKGFFDNIPGVGNVKGNYGGTTNQAGTTITGNAIVKVAGHTASINLTGTKQVAAPVQNHSIANRASGPTPVDPTGPFNLTTSDFGDGTVNFTTFVAKSRKVGGVITLLDPLGDGPVTVAFKGKFNSDSATRITASARFPVDTGSHVFNIKGNIDINFAMDANSFTGTVSRSIFGHEVFNTTFNGTRVP